jgi:hypothetical protein
MSFKFKVLFLPIMTRPNHAILALRPLIAIGLLVLLEKKILKNFQSCPQG